MNLHIDRAAFETLLIDIQERMGVRADILEKDYYVTLILKELAKNQGELHAYFKGGTALYKALGSIWRYSVDIDLTVEISDCTSKTQAAKRLKKSAKGYSCLERLDEECEDKKGSITAVYKYDPIVEIMGLILTESVGFTYSK
jgi:predicted nucleotidyltransferase component of viral defense system